MIGSATSAPLARRLTAPRRPRLSTMPDAGETVNWFYPRTAQRAVDNGGD